MLLGQGPWLAFHGKGPGKECDLSSQVNKTATQFCQPTECWVSGTVIGIPVIASGSLSFLFTCRPTESGVHSGDFYPITKVILAK